MQHHITVLKEEAVEALRVEPGKTIVDATVGSMGHTKEILKQLDGEGILVGIDQDPSAIQKANELETGTVTTYFSVENFRNIDQLLNEHHIFSVDGILADLGWRTEQFEEGERGFSFNADEALLMTYGDPENYPFTAGDIVNGWKEEDIRNVIRGYGEERFAGRIAKAIVNARENNPITTSQELADIIAGSVPGFYRTGKVHPATRTFQALRIAVNDELDALSEFITKAIRRLNTEGRIAIITFHSLEDRIVKHTFRDQKNAGLGEIITKRPIRPSDDEKTRNPRSRSAKLRIFERNEINQY